ncbi:MAG: hypothetical protein ACKV19_17970 [Verrucomicrobiales bacterium]
MVEKLCCPVTRQPLHWVSETEAGARGFGAGPVLLRADGRVYYKFDDHGFPVLLPDSGVAVSDRGGVGGGPDRVGPAADRG